MHVPDGFLDVPTSAATGVLAAAAVGVALRGARRELAGTGPLAQTDVPRTAPLAGLVAAFLFAVQMLNFPVAAGTSGHLLGGALAALLVGPCTGVLCVTVVLLLQAFLFADGGLTALGVNILDMAVVTVVVAYGLFWLLARVLPPGRTAVTAGAFVAALVSVPAAAVAFTAMYALGGTTDVPLGTVFSAMVGVHVLIGLGEAAITAATVGAVLAVRPDLVYAARGQSVPLRLRTATPAAPGDGAAADPVAPTAEPAARTPQQPAARRRRLRPLWVTGLLLALVLGGGVSYYASANPDGLEKVAADHGIDDKEREHAVDDSPLADYGVAGIPADRLSVGLAGILGVGATLAVGTGVFLVVRRRSHTETRGGPDATQPAAPTGDPRG